jgi:hypothetical protein
LKIGNSLINAEELKSARDRRGSSNVSQVSNEASAKMSKVSEVNEPGTGRGTTSNSKAEVIGECQEDGAQRQNEQRRVEVGEMSAEMDIKEKEEELKEKDAHAQETEPEVGKTY